MTSDDLSWLIYPTTINLDPIIDHDPTEQVANPTAVAIEDIVHPPPQTTHVLSEVSKEQSKQEVTPEPLIDIMNDVPSVESPRIYELPQKSTRGIPPKRYDPEFKAQRSPCIQVRYLEILKKHSRILYGRGPYSSPQKEQHLGEMHVTQREENNTL